MPGINPTGHFYANDLFSNNDLSVRIASCQRYMCVSGSVSASNRPCGHNYEIDGCKPILHQPRYEPCLAAEAAPFPRILVLIERNRL